LFPLVVPWEFVARMRPGDPHDPLLRQVLPWEDEQAAVPGFDPDPVAERSAALVPGLLQKYAGRALMVTTPTCAVHCRYCFRRHFDYDSAPRTLAAWSAAFDCLAADPTIEEVLLSGGDPLTLPDARLAELVRHLESIPHLRRLRIHTRLPIVIPQRITNDLLSLLRTTRLTTLVVIHANHPAELDTAVADSVARLVDSGIMVLNQAVLLRHVNDSTEVLAALSRRLLDLRVLPYYLHQLDAVAGAAHFHVPPERGEQLIASLRSELPGYAVPRYVREVPGEPSKVVLA
jgi:EF-P beta-lysylation protein EpmB